MEPVPLPSYIHYELLLQLLERKTVFAIGARSPQHEQIHELIVVLRKALAQQKQLEESCNRANIPIEFCWSLNHTEPEQVVSSNLPKSS
jgi:uncharacterized protein YktB (UPF0637 family)